MHPKSPPTERVVAILNLLATHAERGMSSIQIARELGITKSTCALILATLEDNGFVHRRDREGFVLGRGLLPIATAVHNNSYTDRCRAVLEQLWVDTRRACRMMQISSQGLQTIAQAGVFPADPPVLNVGQRLPLHAPFGIELTAWHPQLFERATQRALLEKYGLQREQLERQVRQLKEQGYLVWRYSPEHAAMISAIRDLAPLLHAEGQTTVYLRDRLLELMALGTRESIPPQSIAAHGKLAVSHIAVPVDVGDDDTPPLESIDLLVFEPEIDAGELRALIERLRQAVRQLRLD